MNKELSKDQLDVLQNLINEARLNEKIKPRSKSTSRKDKRSEKKAKKKREFSKYVMNTVLLAGAYVVLYSSAAMIYLQDLSSLPTLITAVFVEVGVATGYYYWKAKNENVPWQELQAKSVYGKLDHDESSYGSYNEGGNE